MRGQRGYLKCLGQLSPVGQVRTRVQPQGSHSPLPAAESLSLESAVLCDLAYTGSFRPLHSALPLPGRGVWEAVLRCLSKSSLPNPTPPPQGGPDHHSRLPPPTAR